MGIIFESFDSFFALKFNERTGFLQKVFLKETETFYISINV